MIDISQILQEAATMIEVAGKAVADRTNSLRKCSLQLEAARRKAILKYADQAKNQKVLEAMVGEDEEVQTWEAAMITITGNLDLAKIGLKKQEDLFITARKLASLSDEERKYQNDSYVSRKLQNA